MEETLKSKITELRNTGKTYNEISKILDCSKGTIAFHLSQACRDKTYQRTRNSRTNLRKALKLELGGKCVRCGYSTCLEALDFHHRDSDKKLHNIGRSINHVSPAVLREEIKKCDLLCCRCHREHHAGIW